MVIPKAMLISDDVFNPFAAREGSKGKEEGDYVVSY